MRGLLYIGLAMWHARRIQDFFWEKPGKPSDGSTSNASWGMWMATMEKRYWKLNDIDSSNPSWRVESRKRALQLSAVAIAFIQALNTGKVKPPEAPHA
jgi:hypothetical protein